MSNSENIRYYESLRIQTPRELENFIKRWGVHSLNEGDWVRLTLNGAFSTTKLIEKYADYLDWESLAFKQNIPEELLEKFNRKLDWFSISYFQKLSWEFIKKYKSKLSINYLMKNDKLSQVPYREKIAKLYEEMKDNPKAIKQWDVNKEKSSIFGRKIEPPKYTSFDEKPVEVIEEKEDLKEPVKEIFIKEEVVKEKSEVKKEEKPKASRLTEKKINEMNKAQLKEELDKRKIRYLYKDNLQELKNKLLDSIRGKKK